MPVVVDGPILAAFKSVLSSDGQPLSKATVDCGASVVRLLEHHQTTARRPGMLLGKVQSGKTRAFVAAISIGFDSGFDVAVVLTKTSKALVAQTMRRLQHDLGLAMSQNKLRVFNAASKIKTLNEWQKGLKLIFVAKKHPQNLRNLQKALLEDHPDLTAKRTIIVDDEADFASVGYQRRHGDLQVRSIQNLIDELRTGMRNSVYLEVTATPYSLYLQPADIAEPSGQAFQPLRPAFTKRIEPHAGYVGGEFYFEAAQLRGLRGIVCSCSCSRARTRGNAPADSDRARGVAHHPRPSIFASGLNHVHCGGNTSAN